MSKRLRASAETSGLSPPNRSFPSTSQPIINQRSRREVPARVLRHDAVEVFEDEVSPEEEVVLDLFERRSHSPMVGGERARDAEGAVGDKGAVVREEPQASSRCGSSRAGHRAPGERSGAAERGV